MLQTYVKQLFFKYSDISKLNNVVITALTTKDTLAGSINITTDLPFLNIHYPFINERISVYLDNNNRMF